MSIMAYSLAVLGMVVAPLVLAGLLRRRLRVPWMLFLVGCATFVLSQVVHLPLNAWLTRLGVLPSGVPLGTLRWRTALVLGLTAGLCEELLRAGGYAVLRRCRAYGDALMLGLGHGGIESMVIGGVQTAAGVTTLFALRGVDPATLGLDPAQITALSLQLATVMQQPWLAVLPLLERLLAMALHLTLSVLVWRAFVRRNGWWVVAAVVAHAAVDMGAVMLTFSGAHAWLIEGALLVVVMPGLVWLCRLARREAGAAPSASTPAQGLRLFGLALRKEWLELRRTRRLLVIVVVFALFGMSSPLLAYFTPQIVASVPEAEMFAGLIPEPTVADATGQYVKNLTQFGFILVILLGMGAVAGERERGTAVMVLSKPLPRSTWVLSKFVAQALAYGVAMVLGGLGGYYYTWILFGDIAPGAFALITLLLYVWLLVFVAVTLLASTLGRSIGASAGIGLGIAVVLLLAGSVPRWGALAPGGLVAWAGAAGLGGEAARSAVNGGALALSAVVIALCLVGSIAAIERHEL